MRALLVVLVLSLPCDLRAADPAVWSALVLATNEEQPEATPPELQKFKQKLENVFGYNQFELIGQHTEIMDDPRERWFIPSKNFSLRAAAKAAPKGAYTMKLELFEDQRMLTRFDAHCGPQSPLFIRGPLYAGGQLIIILLVK